MKKIILFFLLNSITFYNSIAMDNKTDKIGTIEKEKTVTVTGNLNELSISIGEFEEEFGEGKLQHRTTENNPLANMFGIDAEHQKFFNETSEKNLITIESLVKLTEKTGVSSKKKTISDDLKKLVPVFNSLKSFIGKLQNKSTQNKEELNNKANQISEQKKTIKKQGWLSGILGGGTGITGVGVLLFTAWDMYKTFSGTGCEEKTN